MVVVVEVVGLVCFCWRVRLVPEYDERTILFFEVRNVRVCEGVVTVQICRM